MGVCVLIDARIDDAKMAPSIGRCARLFSDGVCRKPSRSSLVCGQRCIQPHGWSYRQVPTDCRIPLPYRLRVLHAYPCGRGVCHQLL